MRRLLVVATVITLAVGGVGWAPSADAAPNVSGAAIRAVPFASGLDTPVAIANRKGDPRLYVAEKGGTIRIVNANGTLVSTPVLTLAVADSGEQGLLGLTFSPGGAKLYAYYTAPGTGAITVAEYAMAGDVANTGTRRELLSIPHPGQTNHNGGDLHFGRDGMLYVSTGDGGGGGDPNNNAQNINSLLGKMLRLSVTPDSPAQYTIPSGNPFVGRAGRDEIWMYGLRNPWRWSFDRSTGDMWIGDVGQNAYEEIDFAAAGRKGINWGWRNREGFHAYNGGAMPAGAKNPLLEVDQDDGSCAIVGGYVYRGTKIANLNGAYIFGDFCRSMLVGVVQRNGTVVERRDMRVEIDGLTGFGEDRSGELYAATIGGTIYKLTQGTTIPAGYWQAAADGRVFGFHGAKTCVRGASGVVGIAGNSLGYRTVTASGAITACRLKHRGSMAGKRLNKPIVGMAATPSGNGYWMVATDGGIFSFGDARYYGSTGAIRLNQPIVGMAATTTGRGYWLVARDGGMFSFGNARYYGSTGGRSLPAPITGMSASPGGKGYWLTGRSGVVYAFGDARNWGNASSKGVAVTGIAHN